MRSRLLVLSAVFVLLFVCLVHVFGPPKAEAAEPLRIGCIYDLTGAMAVYGAASAMSAKAALDQIKRAGGIAGRQVEYIIEDGASDATTGIRKFNKLVEKDNCDFVLLSCNSGLGVGCAPVAKRLNTIAFTEATGRSLTAEKGNRFMFRQINNTELAALAMSQFAVKELGKSAYALAADYEYGHSFVDTAEKQFAALGIKLVGKSFSPIGTFDFVPYLSKVPKNIDFILNGYLAADAVKLVNQAWDLGFRVPVFFGALQSIRYEDLGSGADLVWCGTYASRTLDGYSEEVKPFQKKYREIVGFNDEGWDKSGKYTTEYAWPGWEGAYWLKKGIEESGWKTKKDNLKFIKALEGAKVKASNEFPQGSKLMRAEDHQAITDAYIIKAEKGRVITKARVPYENLIALHPPTVNFTKEGVR